MSLTYVNKKGNEVKVGVSRHAYQRFRERWALVFPDTPLEPSDTEEMFARWFANATLVKNLSRKERIRVKRNRNTLYMRSCEFTFVVHDCLVCTVEISDKNKRHLNKCPEKLNK